MITSRILGRLGIAKIVSNIIRINNKLMLSSLTQTVDKFKILCLEGNIS